MKTYTLVVLILSITGLPGCVAMYDNNDHCQTWNKPSGYQQPNYCGSSAGKSTYITRDTNGRVIATTRAQ
jgi:hypothetical protein